jgi:hypothetical protein
MDCDRVKENLAALVPTASDELHLEACTECAAFAKDVQHFHRVAMELPRPRFERGASGSSRDRQPFAMLSVGISTLAIFIVLALWPTWQTRETPEIAAVDVDLFASLTKARSIWAPEPAKDQWAWLELGFKTDEQKNSSIDPLASLRAAALLIPEHGTESVGRSPTEGEIHEKKD